MTTVIVYDRAGRPVCVQGIAPEDIPTVAQKERPTTGAHRAAERTEGGR
ncbi:MAG: hypothetical protein M0026_21470 [Nocardiopsaceae bacterium]|nr:hypothetical protein [Nocardiopsaceae bacterium]